MKNVRTNSVKIGLNLGKFSKQTQNFDFGPPIKAYLAFHWNLPADDEGLASVGGGDGHEWLAIDADFGSDRDVDFDFVGLGNDSVGGGAPALKGVLDVAGTFVLQVDIDIRCDLFSCFWAPFGS
jgi:hypothetical protein